MNIYTWTILGVFAGLYVFDTVLEVLNYSHIKKKAGAIPEIFEEHIDSAKFAESVEYSLEKIRINLISGAFFFVLAALFIFSGAVVYYDEILVPENVPFAVRGALFFLFLHIIKTMLSIPFSLYGSFRIEKRYGFNTMTPRIWIVDFIKTFVISSIIIFTLCAAAFQLVKIAPDTWWLWVWLFFLLFSIFLLYVSPYILEPLFNKFTPVEDEELAVKIREMMSKVGIKVSRIMQMDASKRTKHSNAYFTGIGHVKRIVLYDTLLEQMDRGEILAVLAHEAGHWKLKHILKYLFIIETLSLAACYGAFRFIESGIVGALFPFAEGSGQAVQFFLAFFLLGLIMGPLGFLFNIYSRYSERQADDFAVHLCSGRPLASALIKLSKENLANLNPHPLYAFVNYSHPEIVDRVQYLQENNAPDS